MESDLAEVNSRYWEVAQVYTAMSERIHEAQMVARVEYLESRLGPLGGKKILDVGAGYGILNLVLRKRERAVSFHAVEYDQGCHSRLAQNGAASIVRDLAACRDDGFDIAVLSHVLEHVRDPKALLASVRGRLATGGWLFLEVPNQDHLHKADIGTHLLFFSPRSLRSLLASAGFSVEHLDTVGAPVADLTGSSRGADKGGNGRWAARVRASRLYQAGSGLANRLRAAIVSLDSLRADLQLASYGEGRQWIRCLAAVSSSPTERP